MKILHYSLGFPPYRTGGLTKFCMDMMEEQRREGHDVALLWPGEMKGRNTKTRVRHNKDINGIQSWEVINPTPISYDEGIKNITPFTQSGDIECYEVLLQNVRPDVVHVHTLMGLHSSFLEACRKIKVKIVFTAHDFFPICPKVTMFRNGQICNCISKCEECSECNMTALAIWKIKLLQSRLYRGVKNNLIVQKMRKGHRDNYLSGESENKNAGSSTNCANDYLQLRQHYSTMLDQMDIIHYNSSVTKAVYERYLGERKSALVSITHSDIADNRKLKDFSDKELRMTYLGPFGGAKGFFLLKAALDELWEERHDFSLKVFFQMEEKSPYIKTHDRYGYSDLTYIFEETDILVVPSIWYETFGFTVLEAISFGVPVVITSNVGAKDILPVGAGVIVDNITVEGMKETLSNLTVDKLKEMNKCIIKNGTIQTVKKMCEEIEKKCYKGE